MGYKLYLEKFNEILKESFIRLYSICSSINQGQVQISLIQTELDMDKYQN